MLDYNWIPIFNLVIIFAALIVLLKLLLFNGMLGMLIT